MAAKGSDSFPIRLASGVAGIVLVLAVVLAGLWPLAVFTAFVAAWATAELMGLAARAHQRPNTVLAVAVASAFPLATAVFGEPGQLWVAAAAVVAALLWLLAFEVASVPGTALTLFGSFYVGLLISYLVLTRRLDDGTFLVLVIFVGTWISDTAAYAVGTTVGRHKLAVAISPGKTWEGTIGGFLITVVLFTAAWFLVELTAGERAVLGAVIAAAATLGDLVESRIKRHLQVKDSGTLIPGHGGMLDRFDSLLLVGPAVYVTLRALGWPA